MTLSSVVLLCGLCIGTVPSAYAQSNSSIVVNDRVSANYSRRSLTLVPLTGNSQQSLYASLRDAVVGSSTEARFDFISCSENALTAAQNSYQSEKGFWNETSLGDLLSRYILPEVEEVVNNDDTIRSRVGRNLHEEETTAAANLHLNLSKDAVMGILSHSYIGALRLDTIVVSNEGKNDISITAKARISWYRLNFDEGGEHPTLLFVGEKKITSTADGKITERAQLALQAISKIPFKAIEATKGMNEFRPTGQIASVADGILVTLGTREDMSLDDGLDVYENTLVKGKPIQKYVGFVRIDRVGDNNSRMNAKSRVYSIISGDFERYQTVAERRRFFDLRIRPGFERIMIPKHAALDLLESDGQQVATVELSALVNLARWVGIPQFFAVVGGSYGIPLVHSVVDAHISNSLISGSLGVMKKFWLSRFNVQIEVAGLYERYAMAATQTGADASLTFSTIGARASVGLEFAITPDLLIGASAHYKLLSPPVAVTYKDKGNTTTYVPGDDLYKQFQWDSIKLGGIGVSLSASYSFAL